MIVYYVIIRAKPDATEEAVRVQAKTGESRAGLGRGKQKKHATQERKPSIEGARRNEHDHRAFAEYYIRTFEEHYIRLMESNFSEN
jgi:hypothetical protein